MKIISLLCVLMTLGVHGVEIIGRNVNDTALDRDDSTEQHSKILSRRKRFLIFPDGSSFQLVFCTQNHGYLQLGNIVWFGNTAALAWELPSDPQLFNLYKEHSKIYSNRRGDTKHIYYLDEDGKVLSKVPYRRRPIVNPAFAKRSIEGDTPNDNKVSIPMSIKEMHERERQKDLLKELDKNRIEFHRQTKGNFYEKVEKVFEGLGWNGRDCVLRLLCDSGKASKDQGPFLEEILKATFTLPRGRGFDSEPHKQYDIAHGTSGDCTQMYPDCNISLM
ncbi:hypothetical protein ABMA28_005872 [Loxostege sticticalis]|uniref:Uncharacterized protein n=1 Tax=Loxostege sticticalis TaxID=481309 RepID=A0ABD0SN54_LOXSC